jgi:hypothetical protein
VPRSASHMLLAGALAVPLAAEAQQAAKVSRV